MMKLLNHLKASDYKYLKLINDDWPYQFLSEYTRFNKHYSNSDYYIIKDEKLNAYMPVRLYEVRTFRFGQIEHAPVSAGIELKSDDQLDFFNRFIDFAKSTDLCTKLVQPPPSGILGAHPAGSQFCDFGSYLIDLGQSEEEILQRFHPKYQKAVAHSIKNHAEIRVGRETLDDFYELYVLTMNRAGLTPIDKSYFRLLCDYMGEARVKSAAIYEDGRPVGAVFIISSRYAAQCTHAGSTGDTKLYGSMKLLNYNMMKVMKSQGVNRYDFVGVRLKNSNPALEGIFRFKKGFGGDLKVGYLWKAVINPKTAGAFETLLKMRIGKKPMPDIIDQVKLDMQNQNNG